MHRIFLIHGGTLGREAWAWAILAATATFLAGALSLVSLALNNASCLRLDMATAWIAVLAVFYWYVITLLCSKRLADCDGPPWFPLAVAIPGFVLILGFSYDLFDELKELGPVVIGYLIALPLPPLVACATCKGST